MDLLDPTATHEPDDPSKPGVFSFYIPTNPVLRDTPAFNHFQSCIAKAVEHALESGTPEDVVRHCLEQKQTQFDTVLRTLDRIFRLGDALQTAATHGDDVAAASLHVAEEQAPQSSTNLSQRSTMFAPAQFHRSHKLPDPSLPQQTASVTADWNGQNAADSLRIGDNFPDTPQFSLGKSDGLRNREQHLVAVAAQRSRIDEKRRAANTNMVGDWLENGPEFPDDHEQQLAQSGHDTQDDIALPDAPPNPNKRRRTFFNQGDDTVVDLPGIGDPTGNPLPFRAKDQSNFSPRGESGP